MLDLKRALLALTLVKPATLQSNRIYPSLISGLAVQNLIVKPYVESLPWRLNALYYDVTGIAKFVGTAKRSFTMQHGTFQKPVSELD
jgi:hypothetical protein